MSVLECRLLTLTELQRFPEMIEKIKGRNTPFFLACNGKIEWTVKPVNKIPKKGCYSPEEYARQWQHWRSLYGRREDGVRLVQCGARYGYVNFERAELPASTLILSLHQLRRNARRVLDPMLLTRDWETPTRCFITCDKKPLAVITAGVKVQL